MPTLEEFTPGSTVRFRYLSDRLQNYYYDEIPEDLISHGSTLLSDEYDKNGAKVVSVYDDFVIVRVPTTTREKGYTQLAWKPEQLFLYK